MTKNNSTIFYTLTDEAPALATHSFLPIVKAFTTSSDLNIETKNISLAGRVIANFPEYLLPEQQISDDLAKLGALVKQATTNIIKLPNISASVPQLHAVIKELQSKGYQLPNYPEEPQNEAEEMIKQRYDKLKGSAVNPVLREGNSDRRVPASVKQYARNNPHSMGVWSPDSKSHVVSMNKNDFYGSEQSVCVENSTVISIEFTAADGSVTLLKKGLSILDKEIIDASILSKASLVEFYEQEIAKARAEDVLLSLHLKATMMKVSDPVIFGYAVKVYYKDVFHKHAAIFNQLGVDANNGIGDVYLKIKQLPAEKKLEIEADIQAVYKIQPALAMVDTDNGITNLHVPSDVIVDASMPACIRSSGKMWGSDGKLKDTKAMIPDRSYAGVYQATIDFCKRCGAFDPTTMGSVPNVGLMAQKAEEYGSHDKTFNIAANGIVRVIDSNNNVLMEHQVAEGDIWRMCQAKDLPIQNWVKLAVNRARLTAAPAIFWLDPVRAHDREMIKKVNTYLAKNDTSGLEIRIMPPIEATEFSLARIKDGLDTISVTGNVLRDYLTDLFPILEVGTSSKMLSIVPLMAGGGLFETGAGGCAPKHVQQFIQENHFRWDSIGEFLALSASLDHFSRVNNNGKTKVLADTLDQAITKFLLMNRSPSRIVGELDTRGSHFYLAMYWAQALSEQSDNAELKLTFSSIAAALLDNENKIIEEINMVQGRPAEMDGYYLASNKNISQLMRPSKTFKSILNLLL